MRFIISLILIALLSYALCLFLPWWTIAVAAFTVSAFIIQRPGISFLCGFLALFLLWGGISWWVSTANHHILADRISVLIIGQENPIMLILLTAVLGGVVAGVAALAGSYLHPKRLSSD